MTYFIEHMTVWQFLSLVAAVFALFGAIAVFVGEFMDSTLDVEDWYGEDDFH